MWRVTGIPSTSLDESIRTSKIIADAFKEFPEVDSTLAMIGRAEKGETADVNYMEIYTALKPPEEWSSGRSIKQLEEAMQEALEKQVPNVVPGYTQPIQMRVEELISGVRATLALKLYGTDLAELDRLSAGIKNVLAKVPGVADLSLEANVGKPQIRIAVDRAALAQYGMNAGEVLTIVRNGLGGEPVSVLLDGVRRFGEFQKSLGVAKNILSDRLRTLVAHDILAAVPASDGSAYQEYVLTEKGLGAVSRHRRPAPMGAKVPRTTAPPSRTPRSSTASAASRYSAWRSAPRTAACWRRTTPWCARSAPTAPDPAARPCHWPLRPSPRAAAGERDDGLELTAYSRNPDLRRGKVLNRKVG